MAMIENTQLLRSLLADIDNLPDADSGERPPNVQGYHGMGSTTATAYAATAVKLIVGRSGIYTVSWVGTRTTSSGSNGSQLYINGTAYGSASTTFTNTYVQSTKLTNVSLTEGQEVAVYAKTARSSYSMFVGNLILEQTS